MLSHLFAMNDGNSPDPPSSQTLGAASFYSRSELQARYQREAERPVDLDNSISGLTPELAAIRAEAKANAGMPSTSTRASSVGLGQSSNTPDVVLLRVKFIPHPTDPVSARSGYRKEFHVRKVRDIICLW